MGFGWDLLQTENIDRNTDVNSIHQSNDRSYNGWEVVVPIGLEPMTFALSKQRSKPTELWDWRISDAKSSSCKPSFKFRRTVFCKKCGK
jgi:hypothetical protein